jgi:hypothetical protein
MRAVVAFITGLALIAAGLDVALASPASAQVLQRPGIVVGTADNAHHVNAAATEVVIEAELKAPPSCQKHACSAAPSRPAALVVLFVYVLAGQSQRTAILCTELASGPAVAGGDPVNGGDPSGLCTTQWWCPFVHSIGQAATDTHHALDCVTSACYATKTGSDNLVAGAHNTLNYIAGLPPVAEPYPCSNGDAFALGGQVPYWAVGVLVPGAGDLAAIDDLYFDSPPPAAEGGLSITASDGTDVTGFTFHGINRVIGDGGSRAGVTPQALLDALKNPVAIRQGVDNLGRPFKIYIGRDARVVMNPATGNVVSVNPLSGAGANP